MQFDFTAPSNPNVNDQKKIVEDFSNKVNLSNNNYQSQNNNYQYSQQSNQVNQQPAYIQPQQYQQQQQSQQYSFPQTQQQQQQQQLQQQHGQQNINNTQYSNPIVANKFIEKEELDDVSKVYDTKVKPPELLKSDQQLQQEMAQKQKQKQGFFDINAPNKDNQEETKRDSGGKTNKLEISPKKKHKQKKNSGSDKEGDSEDEEERKRQQRKKRHNKRKQQQGSSKSASEEEDSDENGKKDQKQKEREELERKKRRKEKQKRKDDYNAALALKEKVKQEKKDKKIKEKQDEQAKLEQELLKKQQRQAKPDPDLQVPDIKTFLTNPAPKGVIVQCQIRREKSFFSKNKYHMFLCNKANLYLMSAKKQSFNKSSNYTICMHKDNFGKNTDFYLGKLRGNFFGTEFNIFNGGDNPKKAKQMDKIREQLGVIVFEKNVLGKNGPRKMKVMIPDIKENGQKFESKPLKENEGLLQDFRAGRVDGIRFFFNKPPKWNEILQSFVLNFDDRINKPSIKNFMLIEEKDETVVYLQFGRTNEGKELFNLDFQWPLSPIQAFAIALSSFDSKLACE